MFLIHLLTLFLFINFYSVGQEYLQGVVYEKEYDGQKSKLIPLEGANIYWLNTNIGTVSDKNGKFKIKYTTQSDKLVVSFIGYISDTIRIINGQEKVNIVLKKGENLPEVEITSKNKGIEINKINPIQVETINSSGLKRLACCNLSESFENTGSVDVVYTDAVTGTKQIQMLGLAGIYTHLLGENLPLMNPLSYSYGLTYFPGIWLQAIQISKGTGSVINGFESITGSINVEFKKTQFSSPFLLNIYQNSDGRLEINTEISKKINNLISSSLLLHTESQFLNIDHNNDNFKDVPLSRQINLFNKWNIEKEKKYCIQYGIHFIYDKKVGGQLPVNFNYNRNTTLYGTSVENKKINFLSKHGFYFKDNQSVGIQLFYTYHNMPSFFGLNTYNASESFLYSNFIYQNTFYRNNTVELGFSYRYIYSNELVKTQTIDTLFKENSYIPGIFLQYTFDYHKIVTIILGSRIDLYNNSKYLYVPRFHIKTEPNENIILRFSAGKGYHIPHIFAENLNFFVTSRKWIIEDYSPLEEAYTIGGSFTYIVKNLSKNNIDITFDVYRTNFLNQVVIDNYSNPHELSIYKLRGKSNTLNYQININTFINNRTEVTLTGKYSDVKVTYKNIYTRKILTPPFKALLIISHNTSNFKWQFDLTTQYVSKTKLPIIYCHLDQHNLPSYSNDYIMIFFQLQRKFNNLELYAGVENLLNFTQPNPIISAQNPYSEFFDASVIWGPLTGRMFYIGLRYQPKIKL